MCKDGSGQWLSDGTLCLMLSFPPSSSFIPVPHLPSSSFTPKPHFPIVPHPQSNFCLSHSFLQPVLFLRKRGLASLRGLRLTCLALCFTFISPVLLSFPSVVFYKHPTLLQTILCLFKLETWKQVVRLGFCHGTLSEVQKTELMIPFKEVRCEGESVLMDCLTVLVTSTI